MAHPTSLASLQFSIACGASGDLIVDYHPTPAWAPMCRSTCPPLPMRACHVIYPSGTGTPSQRHLSMLIYCRRSCHSRWQSTQLPSDSCMTSTWRSVLTLQRAMLRQQARDVLPFSSFAHARAFRKQMFVDVVCGRAQSVLA